MSKISTARKGVFVGLAAATIAAVICLIGFGSDSYVGYFLMLYCVPSFFGGWLLTVIVQVLRSKNVSYKALIIFSVILVAIVPVYYVVNRFYFGN